MDPNAALKRIREIVEGINTNGLPVLPDLGAEFAEVFDGLDEWLAKGGFPPDAWHDNEAVRLAQKIEDAHNELDLLEPCPPRQTQAGGLYTVAGRLGVYRERVGEDAVVLARLKSQHVYDNDDGFSRCHICRTSWPCATARVLGVLEASRG